MHGSGFPKENTFSTHLDLDGAHLSVEDAKRLRLLTQEILKYPAIEIPQLADSLEDLPQSSRATVTGLDRIFWEDLPKTGAGKIFQGVSPVGSAEKARAVMDITEALSTSLESVFYVGDSITDVEVLRAVRDSGGVSVSFNGNQYAVRHAEFSVLSDSLQPISGLVDVFSRLGRPGVLEAVKELLRAKSTDKAKLSSESSSRICIVDPSNLEEVIEQSLAFRRKVRGEAVATLG